MSKFKAINQTHNIQITKFEYFHSEKFETLLICEQGPVSRTIFFYDNQIWWKFGFIVSPL